MGAVFIGCFGGELVPHATNDRGVGVKAPIVGIVLMWYFGEELVPLGNNDRRGGAKDVTRV